VLGSASRTKADWSGRWFNGLDVLKAEMERAEALLESIRLPGAEALQTCRSSVGRMMDAIVGATTELSRAGRVEVLSTVLRSKHTTIAVSSM